MHGTSRGDRPAPCAVIHGPRQSGEWASVLDLLLDLRALLGSDEANPPARSSPRRPAPWLRPAAARVPSPPCGTAAPMRAVTSKAGRVGEPAGVCHASGGCGLTCPALVHRHKKAWHTESLPVILVSVQAENVPNGGGGLCESVPCVIPCS